MGVPSFLYRLISHNLIGKLKYSVYYSIFNSSCQVFYQREYLFLSIIVYVINKRAPGEQRPPHKAPSVWTRASESTSKISHQQKDLTQCVRSFCCLKRDKTCTKGNKIHLFTILFAFSFATNSSLISQVSPACIKYQ